MADIVLATFTARYSHSAFGLRCLAANMGDLADRTVVVEFDIGKAPLEAAEELLALEPRVLCLSVHVWNVAVTRDLVALLARVAPDLPVVLGGPEVAYELDAEPLVRHAACIVRGEGDLVVGPLCADLLAGRRPAETVLTAPPPDLANVALPYDRYTDEDVAHRVVYVETSRGCPFRCAYCMSSIDGPLRLYALDRLFPAFERLLARGVRHFKFVDRSFNVMAERAVAVLEFFRERYVEGLLVHVELMPCGLTPELRRALAAFPAGALHVEVGVQTFDVDVSRRVDRPLDPAAVVELLTFLRRDTGAVVHADLIVGLPGETVEVFARGFDRLAACRPHELQVGMLKRLRGTPLTELAPAWDLRFAPHPPYEVLQTSTMSFADIQRLRRFGRFVELLHNRGSFPTTTERLWTGSAFEGFSAAADGLFRRLGRSHGISLDKLAEALFDYLVDDGADSAAVARSLADDYRAAGRPRLPPWLRAMVPP